MLLASVLQPTVRRVDTARVHGSERGDGPDRLTHRRVSGSLPSAQTTTWTPLLPEFSAVANGLSLLMPSLEPYVLKAVRRGADDDRVGPELRFLATDFVAQELAHHQQHRAFNDEILLQVPSLRHLERAQRKLFGSLDTHTSVHSGLAYAAGAEAVAFFTARWVERRRHRLLAGAEGDAANLFVWHLAEEVEHKNVAFDVYQANGGGRLRYLVGIISALIVMALSIVAASTVLIVRERLWWHPMTHLRLIGWTLSFVFEVFPMLGLCLMKDHHPSHWSNPEWLGQWLAEYDAHHGVVPAWNLETLDGTFPTEPFVDVPMNQAVASSVLA